MFVEEIKELFNSKGFKLLRGKRFLSQNEPTLLIHKETKSMCVIEDELSKYNVYLYIHNPLYKNFKDQHTYGTPVKQYTLMNFIKLLKEEENINNIILKISL